LLGIDERQRSAVKRLLQITPSGRTRAAQRSSQCRPDTTSWSQKIEVRPEARTTGPKMAWVHGE
jgi:hypothetical protein